MELGETPEQCVVREVREETGVEVKPVRLTGV
jgi:8-oxo-dGTP diphosphatase